MRGLGFRVFRGSGFSFFFGGFRVLRVFFRVQGLRVVRVSGVRVLGFRAWGLLRFWFRV